MYTYFHWHKHDFGHDYIDIYAGLFTMVFQSFQNFSSFIILYCLKTYCYDLFVCPWKRQILCFKETLFFCISYKLFNKYFSLPQSSCQFRVSKRKWAKIVMMRIVMKKPYVPRIIGFSGRDFNYLISILMALRMGFFKVIYSGWVSMTSFPLTFIFQSNIL